MAAACRLVRLAKQVRRSLLTREANASMRRIARFSCGGEDTRLAGRPFRDSSRRVISPDELETHEYPGILARFSVPPGRGLIDGATQRHQKMACFVCRWNRSVKKLLRACLGAADDTLEEIGQGKVEGVAEALDVDETEVAGAALDVGQVGAVDAYLGGQLLLGQAAFLCCRIALP